LKHTTLPAVSSNPACTPCGNERRKRRELGFPPGYPESFGCLHPGPEAVDAACARALQRYLGTGSWGGTWAEPETEVRKGPEGGTLT
jgi:hypothetical protein